MFILLFLICLYFKVGDANVSCVVGHDPREKERDDDIREKGGIEEEKSLCSWVNVVQVMC